MKAIPETTGMYSAELSTERGVGKDRTWGNQKKKKLLATTEDFL